MPAGDLQLLPLVFQLREEARVLQGDHGLVGEGGDQLDLVVGERARLAAPQDDDPQHGLVLEQGDADQGPEAAQLLRLAPAVLGVYQHVRDADGAPFEGHLPHQRAAPRRDRVARQQGVVVIAATGGHLHTVHVAVEPEDLAAVRPAQADSVLQHGLEHGPHVARGPADHFEDLAGRRLALQRLGQLAVALL